MLSSLFCSTLIFAGHETTRCVPCILAGYLSDLDMSSGALARVLHLLSNHPEIQDHLRAELNSVPPVESYNDIHSLKYLDAVCREVLRLYPPAMTIDRQALMDWVVPLHYPLRGNDGKQLVEIKIKKGTQLHLALREANRCR